MSRIRAFFADNLSLKVLSLLLALLIHLVVQRDSVREFSIQMPLGVSNVPEGQVFVGDLPEQVQIRVRGRWGGIRDLLTDRARKLICDIGTYRDGERFPFDHRWVGEQMATNGVTVLSVRPSAIDVRLEPLATRTVKIQVSTTGKPAEGYRIAANGLSFKPRTVDVSGPANIVRRIRRVRAAPVDLQGADTNLRVRTRLLGVAGKHVRMSVDEVELKVKLDEHMVKRKLAPKPIVVRGCPQGMRCLLEPAEVVLTAHGLVRAVTALMKAPPDNLVYADLAPAINRKQRRVRLLTHVVEGVTLTMRPPVVRFRVLGEIPAR